MDVLLAPSPALRQLYSPLLDDRLAHKPVLQKHAHRRLVAHKRTALHHAHVHFRDAPFVDQRFEHRAHDALAVVRGLQPDLFFPVS
jgi:hypothetical protein